MPRVQKLSQLTPNKVYSVEGIVKFKHSSQGYTTVIIQQENVQKKIKIPQISQSQVSSISIQQNTNYRFSNCFYNQNGWLMARKPNQSIQSVPTLINDNQITSFSLNLKQICQNMIQLQQKYFSTYVYVYSVQPKQFLSKNEDKQIVFQVLKCYSENCLIDITMWNVSENQKLENLVGNWVQIKGLKIKKMTQDKFILVSSVFTTISACNWNIKDCFDAKNISSYQNLSQIYKKRSIKELSQMSIPEHKFFSQIKAKIHSIVSSDYEGCSKCKRKIQVECQYCQGSTKVNYSFGKVLLEDPIQKENVIQVIVFDQKIKGLFKYAKQNCIIEGKLKTFGRIEEDGQNVISHILTKVDSIFF